MTWGAISLRRKINSGISGEERERDGEMGDGRSEWDGTIGSPVGKRERELDVIPH